MTDSRCAARSAVEERVVEVEPHEQRRGQHQHRGDAGEEEPGERDDAVGVGVAAVRVVLHRPHELGHEHRVEHAAGEQDVEHVRHGVRDREHVGVQLRPEGRGEQQASGGSRSAARRVVPAAITALEPRIERPVVCSLMRRPRLRPRSGGAEVAPRGDARVRRAIATKRNAAPTPMITQTMNPTLLLRTLRVAPPPRTLPLVVTGWIVTWWMPMSDEVASMRSPWRPPAGSLTGSGVDDVEGAAGARWCAAPTVTGWSRPLTMVTGKRPGLARHRDEGRAADLHAAEPRPDEPPDRPDALRRDAGEAPAPGGGAEQSHLVELVAHRGLLGEQLLERSPWW